MSTAVALELENSNLVGLKATALLKLTYLEMFGNDMSWAAFHVLEVMSSQNYPEKRIGYLAAIQSFRPDTEVLVLAENLLKKVRAMIYQTELTDEGSHLRATNNDIPSANSHSACDKPVHGELPIDRFAAAAFT
jgi:hypothetical protein